MKLVTYLILYPLILLISHLPFKILYFFSDITFYLLYYLFRYRRKVVRFNLEISKVTKSKSDLIRIEKEFYRHITDVFFEMFNETPETISMRYNDHLFTPQHISDNGILLIR